MYTTGSHLNSSHASAIISKLFFRQFFDTSFSIKSSGWLEGKFIMQPQSDENSLEVMPTNT